MAIALGVLLAALGLAGASAVAPLPGVMAPVHVLLTAASSATVPGRRLAML